MRRWLRETAEDATVMTVLTGASLVSRAEQIYREARAFSLGDWVRYRARLEVAHAELQDRFDKLEREHAALFDERNDLDERLAKAEHVAELRRLANVQADIARRDALAQRNRAEIRAKHWHELRDKEWERATAAEEKLRKAHEEIERLRAGLEVSM